MKQSINYAVPDVTENLGALFAGRWQGATKSGSYYLGKPATQQRGMFARSPGHWMTPFDVTRLALYKQHSLMFIGNYYEAFQAIRRQLSSISRGDFFDEATWERLYICVNILGLCSKKHADLLAVHPPEIRPNRRDNEPMEQAICRIRKNSKFNPKLYKLALTAGYKGDGAFKVEFDSTDTDSDNPRGKVKIGLVKPDCWFPEFDPDDLDDIKSHTIAYKISAPGIDKPLLKRIVHFDDRIERHLNVVDGNQIQDEIVPEVVGLEPWEEVSYHGLGEPLVIHVKNFECDELPFGLSDYLDIKPLMDELNHRLTQFSNVMDKHSDPKMVGPDLIGPDGKVHIDEYFSYASDEPKPEYLTLPSDALAHMSTTAKDFVPLILFLMEVAPGLVGWSETAAVERAETLRIKNVASITKSMRKQIHFTDAVKKAFRLAMQLENEFGGFKYEYDDVSVVWHDGLPESAREQAETMSLRLAGKPSISQEGAVRSLEGGEEADIEIERMEAEGAMGATNGGEYDDFIKPLQQIERDRQAAEEAATAEEEERVLEEEGVPA